MRWIAFLLLTTVLVESRGARPLTVDDADPVAHGAWELESALDRYEDKSEPVWMASAALSHGLTPGVSVSLSAAWMHGEKTPSGPLDLALDTKWRCWYGEKSAGALILGTKLPTASTRRGLGSGDWDATIGLCVTIPREPVALHVHGAWTSVGGDEDLAFLGIAVSRRIGVHWEAVAECYAEGASRSMGDASVFLRAGVRRQVHESLVFDLLLGGDLRRKTPRLVVSTGLTFGW